MLAWRAGLRRPLPFEVQGSRSSSSSNNNYLEAMAAEPEELARPHIAALLHAARPTGPREVAPTATPHPHPRYCILGLVMKPPNNQPLIFDQKDQRFNNLI